MLHVLHLHIKQITRLTLNIVVYHLIFVMCFLQAVKSHTGKAVPRPNTLYLSASD